MRTIDTTTQRSRSNWAAVDGLDDLPDPVGEITTEWTIDAHRYDDSEDYRNAVADLAARWLPGATCFDLEILTDQAGQRVITSTSLLDRDGDFTARHPVVAPLPAGVQLP